MNGILNGNVFKLIRNNGFFSSIRSNSRANSSRNRIGSLRGIYNECTFNLNTKKVVDRAEFSMNFQRKFSEKSSTDFLYKNSSKLVRKYSNQRDNNGNEEKDDEDGWRGASIHGMREEITKLDKLYIASVVLLPPIVGMLIYSLQDHLFGWVDEKNDQEKELERSLVEKEDISLPLPLFISEQINSNQIPFSSQLLSLIYPQIHWFIIAIVASVMSSMVTLQIPKFIGGFIDVLREGNGKLPENFSWRRPIFIATLAIFAQTVLNFVFNFAISKAGDNISTQLRINLFESLLKKDISFFDETSTGELISGMVSDVAEFKNAIKGTFLTGLRSLTQIGGGLVSLYMISSKLTTILILLMPSLVFVGTIYGRILQKLSKRAQFSLNKATAVAEESLSSIRTVRSFTSEQDEIRRYSKMLETHSELSNRLGISVGLFHAFYNVCVSGGFGFILLYGGQMISRGELSSGALTSYLMQSLSLQSSMVSLSILQNEIVRGGAAASRVFESVNENPRIPLSGGQKFELNGRIEFKDVAFRYPSRTNVWVLRKLNFVLEEGKKYAIVGPSGSGKSTIAWLLERFYDPESGNILIDGHDIKSLDPQYLRQQISLVSQEPVLFANTIAENIRFGLPNAEMGDIVRAARLANADDFISSFPAGYNTVVGERGLQLSGGQKQRIAIARAILKNSPILILDEATSALDAESEHLVQDALQTLMRNKTVIMIAHRLSSIQRADQIMVVKGGKVIELGNHRELMNKKGIYANLVSKQIQG